MKEQRVIGVIREKLGTPVRRKTFLKYTAMSGAAFAFGLSSCHKDNKGGGSSSGITDVGGGDTGILNFAYALEQLEAAFYIQVNASFYTNATTAEMAILGDIMNHEIAHRDFFKKALGSSAIPVLKPDFSKIDFTSRSSVLGTAKAFEDLGVSAYNGAGQYIQSADYLTIAGKIVSVEARHAAAIRDLLNPGSADFAGDDVVAASTGLDFSRTPNSTTGGASIVATANMYLSTKISATQLP
jgi:hypothetical protein